MIESRRDPRPHARGLSAVLFTLAAAAVLIGPAVAQPRPPPGPPVAQRPPAPPPVLQRPPSPPMVQRPPSVPTRVAPPRPSAPLPPARGRGRAPRPLDPPERAAAALAGPELGERELVRRHPQLIDVDPRGAPVVRREVIAVSPTPEALAAAARAGFVIRQESRLEPLDLVLVVLEAPPSLSSRQAVQRLREADPAGQYEFNHIYFGGASQAASTVSRRPAGSSGDGSRPAERVPVRVGLVDGGVDAAHPALRAGGVTQRGFARGGVAPSAHGTAVASLLAGSMAGFRGAAPGARLYAADVYGDTPTGGSADAILRSLAWLAQEGVRVINISLVGPPNGSLQAALSSLARRGHIVVAAVGNDGPAAPPRYPAAYPQTVAVTGVDRRRKPLVEAGRGAHLDFAAPGAEMAAAAPAGGLVTVRGTSFAAPLVAGRLAVLAAQRPGVAAEQLVSALAAEAVDLGAPGPDPVYGRGLVAERLRTSPPAARGR